MLQLVYASLATEAWNGDLRGLCAQSFANNARKEITGVVLFEQGTFLHTLEGPKENVEDTFIRIIGDRRHHSLHLLSRRMLTARDFGYGAMVVLETPPERDDAVARIGDIVSLAGHVARTAFDEYFGAIGEASPARSAVANEAALRKLWRDGRGARG